MNDGRLKLHAELVVILGSNNIYFQAPESIKMQYPAIVYTRMDIEKVHASDKVYDQTIKYRVTVLDKDPDSEIVEKLSNMPFAVFDRHYVSNGINHDQFIVSYKK